MSENLIDENFVIMDLKKMEKNRTVCREFNAKYLRVLAHVLPTRYKIFKVTTLILEGCMRLTLDYYVSQD